MSTEKIKKTDTAKTAEQPQASKRANYTDISGAEIIMDENFKVISPGRLVAKRFFRSRLSMVGLITLIIIFAFSFLGPYAAKWIFGSDYNDTTVFQVPRDSFMLTIKEYEGADGQRYDFYDQSTSIVKFKAPISKEHWLGTDTSGYDVFVRLMYGGQISLILSFLVIIAESIIGIFFGGLAGYFGGWVDQLIMRICDILYCLPGLPILLIISAALSAIEGIRPEMKIYYLMGVLTVISWGGMARMVRGQILMLREQEYMMAAETTGMPAWRKIFKHLIPNVMPQIIVQMTLGLGGMILYESTLSYLGLGVPFPKAAWGSMIALADPSKGQEILAYYPNMWVPAGVLIVLTVLAFNFVGDGLRDAFDPKMKR